MFTGDRTGNYFRGLAESTRYARGCGGIDGTWRIDRKCESLLGNFVPLAIKWTRCRRQRPKNPVVKRETYAEIAIHKAFVIQRAMMDIVQAARPQKPILE